jgi:prepilin-type processing-associated H-X9-DG protein
MMKLRGEVRIAILIALPLVGLAALMVRSQAVAYMDASAARDAVLASLSALSGADAPAPAPTPPPAPEAVPNEQDAKLMDAAAVAFIGALQKQDYKAGWELVHPEARGEWTFEDWQSLRQSIQGADDEEGRHGGGGEETVIMLMGRKSELKETITRGMVGMAHVTVTVDAPANLALRKTKAGEWAIDLAATDDLSARHNIGEQLASMQKTDNAESLIRGMMMAEAGGTPNSLIDSALVGGGDLTFQITERHVNGDRATVVVQGTGTLHLAVPLANGDKGWSIAWCQGFQPLPKGKTIAQMLDERGDEGGPASASDRARQASCSSNLKQVGLALLMYCQDYDERFPPATQWHTGAYPYCKNEAIFACPSDAERDKHASYAYNYKFSKLALAKLHEPAQTIVIFESGLHVRDAYDKKGFPGVSLATPARHTGGNTYAFADGHVKWMPDGPPRPQGYPKPPYPDMYRTEKTGEAPYPWLPGGPPGAPPGAYPVPGYGMPGGPPGMYPPPPPMGPAGADKAGSPKGGGRKGPVDE